MQALAFKVLFQKKGTASAILAIALLIALITSINCLVNSINSQTAILGKLTVGQTYLVTSKNSTALSDSQINPEIIAQIKNNQDINRVISQQVIRANLTTNEGNYSVTARGVDDLHAYFGNRQAYIDGAISQNISQTNIGTILSKLTSTNKNAIVTLTINNKPTSLKVTGITQTHGQSDTELTLPLAILQEITQTNTVSTVEFSIKNPDLTNKILTNLTQTLPSDVKITSIQPIATFTQDINNQTVIFINTWSLIIYIVVMAASYNIATRLVNEAEYELYNLRTLGVKKKAATNLIIVYALTIGFVGSLIGLSIGIVGTQTASTFVRWLWGTSQLAPYLEVNQMVAILFLAVVFSFFGSIYPAIKSTRNMVEANPS
jgi:ABC-type lipoprotein release transport system permease subunit